MAKTEQELLAQAITEELAAWLKEWQGGDRIGFWAKGDIYRIILRRLKEGVEA